MTVETARARALRVRWLILLLPAGIYFFSYLHRIAPAVVVNDIMAAFSETAARAGLLMAIYPWLFAIMALPAGTLVDSLGPRWTLTGGSTLMALGAIVFGLAPAFGWAFLGRLVVGLGGSVVFIAWLRLGAAWCRPDETARFAGFTQIVGSLGALVGTAPLAMVVTQLGWRASFVAVGGATALVGAACAAFVRDRPESMGLPAIAPPVGTRGTGFGEALAAAGRVLANRRTWPAILIGAGTYGTYLIFVGLWAVPYFVQVYGVSRLEASRFTAWASVGMLLGAPALGWVSDRMLRGRRMPLVIFTAINMVVWWALAGPSTPAVPLSLLGPLCFALGVAASSIIIVFAIVPEVNDPARPGIALGICNLPSFTTMAVLQWVSGVLLDRGWAGGIVAGARVYPYPAYRSVFLLLAALATSAALLAWVVTETRCRNIWVTERG